MASSLITLFLISGFICISGLISEAYADLVQKYAVIDADNSTTTLALCFGYFPDVQPLPTDLTYSKFRNLTFLDVDSVCHKNVSKNVKDHIVLVDDKVCGNLAKAHYVQSLGAAGILFIQPLEGESKPLVSGNITINDIDIILGVVTHNDKKTLLDLGPNAIARLYAINEPTVEYSFIIMWIIAVFATVTGACWSGVERFKVYTSLNSSQSGRQSSHEAFDNEDETSRLSLTNRGSDYRTLNITYPVVIGLVVGVCVTLLLLYFFFEYVVKVLSIVFSLFLGVAFATLLQSFLNQYLLFRIRWHCKCVKITISEILSYIIAIAVTIWFIVARKEFYAYAIQDVLGISLIIVALKEIRMPSLKIITCLLSLLFFYDIFFVFITPYFTSSRHLIYFFQTGESIMVRVALGSHGEELPIALKVPRFIPDTIRHCNLFSILGFGDMLAPGLLLAYCHGFDLENQTKRLYFAISSISYGLGLLVAFIAVLFMKTAQPALLYLVPFTIIPVIIVSICKKQFYHIWNGTNQNQNTELVNEEDDADREE